MPVTEERARELREAGLKYAGVSVDRLRERNDAFRGQEGAFDEALGGIDAARAAGFKTGLRYTITRHNGGDPTGERVADVDYLGNVRDRLFGEIWTDESNPLLRALRERETHLTGRCGTCQYQDICRGASRLRAIAATEDPFRPDPQCYLTDAERGVPTETDDRVSALASRVISPCWSVPDTHLSYPGRWISNIAWP